MNKFRIHENEHGFFIDYIYSDSENKKCLRLSEDNDYFSFSLFSQRNDLMFTQKININGENPLFLPLNTLLDNNTHIEILEEGSDEGKSISLNKNNDSLDLVFALPPIPKSAISISITNVRLASPNVTFAENSIEIPNFKDKLHLALVSLKEDLKEHYI